MAWQPLEQTDTLPPRVQNLAPLLEAIAVEVVDRCEALDRIERTLAALERHGLGDSGPALQLLAESAQHRRELRHAGVELRHLGCMLISRRPPTIYVREHADSTGGGWLWQFGDQAR